MGNKSSNSSSLSQQSNNIASSSYRDFQKEVKKTKSL